MLREETSHSLCILIPCHNEEVSIATVVQEYLAEFPEAKCIVVDNASTDLTARRALEAGAIVLTEPRKGKAQAVSTALERIQSDVVIMVDGDGSYPATGARILFDEYLRQSTDLITGIRTPTDSKEPIFRPMHQFGTRLFGCCTSLIFGYSSRDIFSGLRLFSRRFYKNVPILSNGFELEMELTVQAVDKSFTYCELEVPFQERIGGTKSKLRTVHDGIRILRSLLVLFRDYKPLYFFGTASLFFFVLGLCAGFPPVYEYTQTHMVGRFPLAILAAALMNLSLFTLLTGMVAETNLRYHREAFQIKIRNFYCRQ